MELLHSKVIATIALFGFIGMLIRLFDSMILKPERLRSKLRKQGIRGPPPSLFLGNISDAMKIRYKGSKLPQEGDLEISQNCPPAYLFPSFEKWRKIYGSTFVFSIANMQILHTSDLNFSKEISKCTSVYFAKPSFQLKSLDPLLGQSIVNSNGELWAYQRKFSVPEFSMDKVKSITKIMADSVVPLINNWKNKIDAEGGVADIKIDDYMRRYFADVITRACFGSNYTEGEEIFLKIRALEDVVAEGVLLHGIPGIKFLPTKSNKKAWRLKEEINTLILKMVKERKDATSNNNDMLQAIIKGSKSSSVVQDPESFVIDSCKGIYLAGYGFTSVAATWTLMLLALNADWQEKVRAEVFEICKNELPNADMLLKMKTISMVVNESLRLYPLVPLVPREALDEMKFGDIDVPKGVNILVSTINFHYDQDIWGFDAHKFNPERFSNGVSGACKHPHAFMPWGFGPHVCLGQHLALAIIKMLLVAVVSNFKFSLSPNYRHCPSLGLALEPEFGVDLLLEKL